MGWGPEVGDRPELASSYIFVFHFRCGRGSAATCDKPRGSDSRTVPLRWRGSDKRGGDVKLEPPGHADINHGLGYINNIGLPVTGKHIRTIISFLTHERIITKIIAFYNVYDRYFTYRAII